MFRTTLTVLAAIALLGVTSTAAVAQQDLRMPDTRDAANAATQTQDRVAPTRRTRPAPTRSPLRCGPSTLRRSRPPSLHGGGPSDDTPWVAIAGSPLSRSRSRRRRRRPDAPALRPVLLHPREVVTALIQTTVIGSYPQPDWLIDRAALATPAAARARAGALASAPALPRAGPGRRDRARVARPGASRHRRRHRRRDPSRELLQPLRDGAGRARRRHPGEVAGARAGRPVPRVVGPDQAAAAGRGRATSRSCAPHRPHDQDHRPRARSRCASRPRRALRRPRSAALATPRRSTRSCTTSSPPVPTSFRSTSRGCRRGPSRRANTRSPAIDRALTGSRARPSCTPASVTPLVRDRRPLPVPRRARRSAVEQLAIEAASPASTCGPAGPGRSASLGVLDLPTTTPSRPPEVVAEPHPAALAT